MEYFFSKESLIKIFQEDLFKKGGKGIDGVTTHAFQAKLKENIDIIHNKVLSSSYKFSPFMEQLISKGRNKNPRLISIPTTRDKLVLYALNKYIQNIYKESIPSILPNTYIKEIKEYREKYPLDHILRYDIKNFYPSINKCLLFKIINEEIDDTRATNLLRSALITPTVPRNCSKLEYNTYKIGGVPQGLSISNILAEIYLSKIDSHMKKHSKSYWRYVDDIVITCDQHEEKKISDDFETEISKIHLKINKEKCASCSISSDFDFLGYAFSDTAISVKKSSEVSYIQKISDIFKWYSESKKNSEIDKEVLKNALIDLLNERITGAISENKRYGWIFYFLEITDKTILYRTDALIRHKISKLPEFTADPPRLKRLIRAYHEAKHSPLSGYIHDYNKYKTPQDKLDFLISRCVLAKADDDKTYSEAEIEARFEQYRNKQLSRLHRDIGVFS